VEIIYSSRDGYLFENEFKSISKKNEEINLHLTVCINETRKKIDESVKRFKNDAYYYVSGNAKMIKETKDRIAGQGIDKRRIISDPFFGY